MAAVLIIIPMIVAIITVHRKNGLFPDKGGIEYSLVLITIALGITLTGSLSLDALYDMDFLVCLMFSH
ncbi:hypothetical protein [Peribacillus asahii]|uniref:hypothetical protein n=1 Tax=Peribacillus asahii TaxID=228899 RepID=UPI00207ACD83|nr:hypothetical protein [Peribacillus asahii]USK60901.1 hypothetical protein LIT37_06140 [Peribacillus asahii]